MNKPILNCCNNMPRFLVTYKSDSKFLVCQNCFQLKLWSAATKYVESVRKEDE